MKLEYPSVSSTIALALALAVSGAAVAVEPELRSPSDQPQTVQPESGSPSGQSQMTHPAGEAAGIQSAEPGTQSGQEAAGASAQALRAEDISGKEVLNQAGEKLGKVDKVVRDQATNHLYAVVGVGGFLGIGQKDVTMPLRDMTLLDGNLVTQSSSTTEELKQWPAYEASQYSELPADQVIDAGEFSAFEGTPIEGSPGQQQAAPPGAAEGQGEGQPHEGGGM
jgi:hypothetical protein